MFVIYGKSDCGFCTQAKTILSQAGYQYEYKDIEGNPANRTELFNRFPMAKSVPQIFLGDHHVGGYSELQNGLATGALKALIALSE